MYRLYCDTICTMYSSTYICTHCTVYTVLIIRLRNYRYIAYITLCLTTEQFTVLETYMHGTELIVAIMCKKEKKSQEMCAKCSAKCFFVRKTALVKNSYMQRILCFCCWNVMPPTIFPQGNVFLNEKKFSSVQYTVQCFNTRSRKAKSSRPNILSSPPPPPTWKTLLIAFA